MPGSSLLRLVLSNLFQEEHPPYSFTVSAVGNYYSHQLTSHSCHAILLFIVPALLDLLDLMYEEGTSPFATHPKTMGFTIGCLLAYCLVYGAELSFSSSPGSTLYAHAFKRGMMLFGSLSVASLASIFLGDTPQWVLYMLYTLLWMGKLLCSLAPMLYRLPGQVEALVRPTWDRCRGLSIFRVPLLRRHNSRRRGNILPL